MHLIRKSFVVAAVSLLALGSALGQEADLKDLSVQQQAVTEVVASNPSLRVTAWVDHDNNSYMIGEAIQLSVRVNEDAYLNIISIGPSGNAVLLYPNEFQPVRRIKAGEIVQIPGEDAGARIVATAPAGNELIRVIASATPIEVIDPQLLTGTGAFRSIEGGAEQVSKDLALALAAEPGMAFYDKVIKTKPTGSAEIVLEPETGEGETASQAPAPLIATNASEYEVGDVVELAVTALSNCNLWVVNVSSDESVHLLFPNNLMRRNSLEAGDTVLVSGGASPVEIQAAGPAGKEAIYALCSEEEAPPWEAGIDFSQLFPRIESSDALGKALIAIEAGGDAEAAIPDFYAWSVTTLTVTD
jgi:hypothetical protein